MRRNATKRPKKGHLASVLQKNVAADFHAAFVQANDPTETAKNSVADGATDPEANIVADDRPRGRDEDNQEDREAVGRRGIDRPRGEDRLTGKRDAEALQADDHKDRGVAVAFEEVLNVSARSGERNHPTRTLWWSIGTAQRIVPPRRGGR